MAGNGHAAAATVIAASDLERIRSRLPDTQASARLPSVPLSARERRPGPGGGGELSARERARELHEKSKLRAKAWNNTLEGSRRKKAEERRRKTELEEIERQRIDAEEAKIQLDQRRHTIERANKLLHDESDRMKAFHSKMMLCDVIAEREAQVTLKAELKKLEQVRDDRFLQMEKQNYRKMLEREMREKAHFEELSRTAAIAQQEQLAQYKEKRYREVEEQMLEGELLRLKAVEDLEADREAEQTRIKLAKAALEETRQANEYLKTVKDAERKKEKAEEEKIIEYAERKERMLKLRKDREEEVFKAHQDARQRMITEQAGKLAEMLCDEDERVEKQVQDKEASDEQKRQEKEAYQKYWRDEINKSREAQNKRRQEERDREKQEDLDSCKLMKEWCKVLDLQTEEEIKAKREKAKQLSKEHVAMAESKRLQRNEAKKQELGVALHARKAMEADTGEFHDYAESCIRDYSVEGKNVIPLIKELRDFRKRSVQ